MYKKKTFEPQALPEVLKEFIGQKKIKNGITKVRVEEAWKKTVGTNILNYTKDIQFRNSTLFVNLSSAPLREELMYGKDKILKHLNESLGSNIITKLVLR